MRAGTSRTFGLLFPILIGGNGNSGTGSANGIHDGNKTDSFHTYFIKTVGQKFEKAL